MILDLNKQEFNSLLTITYCLLHYLPKIYTAEHNGEIGAVVSGSWDDERNGRPNGNQNNETCMKISNILNWFSIRLDYYVE